MELNKATLACLLACAVSGSSLSARAGQQGIFSFEQARRGEKLYAEPCGRCHGLDLSGAAEDPDMFASPPVGGRKFLRKFSGTSLVALFEYIQATMPANNPGYLSEQELVDILAYMLEVSGLPAGNQELVADPELLAGYVLPANASGGDSQ